jgi:hypothetical protein
MKPFKSIIAILVICLFTACATSSYIGDTRTPTSNVDVFYADKDVKRAYRVLGHIYTGVSLNSELVKQRIIDKAKTIGADAVIIPVVSSTGGKDADLYQQADAIAYTD